MESNGKNEPHDQPNDERELLESCCRMEERSWEQFLSRYQKLIYYSIHRTLGLKHYKADPQEIEDLYGDILVGLIKNDCRKLRQYKGYQGATVATWIRTITVRSVIDYVRLQARSGDFVDIDGDGIGLEASTRNPVSRPDEVYDEDEKARGLAAAVDMLDDGDRYFMELYYVRGLEPDQVAQLIGISVKTVYSRVNRLKEKLQKNMARSQEKRG